MLETAFYCIMIAFVLALLLPYGVVTAVLKGWRAVPAFKSAQDVQQCVQQWKHDYYRYHPLENLVSELIERLVVVPIRGRSEFLNTVREPRLLMHAQTAICANRALFMATVIERQGLGEIRVVWASGHTYAQLRTATGWVDFDGYDERYPRWDSLERIKADGPWPTYHRHPYFWVVQVYYILTRTAWYALILSAICLAVWAVKRLG